MPDSSTSPHSLLQGHDPRRLAALALQDSKSEQELGEGKPWTTFGGIDLYEEIGRGGMGVVYRARQRALDRVVAVKVLLRAQFASKEERQRFQREAQAAARLQHPSIEAVHEVGEDEGMPWFSMDYIPGRSLEQALREHPMEARSAARCVKMVAEAIQHAHDCGVLHRDLKPSNILLDPEGEPHITDFGIARIASTETTTNRRAELTRTGQSLGSPGYTAPEQALSGRADARTDVYGLGALLYHLLTARPPFQGPTLDAILIQLRENEPLPPRRLNPSVPQDLETICLKCLRKVPENRYDTAAALADDLGRFLDGKPILARPLGPLGRVWRWTCLHPSMAAMLAVIALLIAGLIGGSLAFARRQQQLERRTTLIADARQLRGSISAGARGQAMAALKEAWQILPSADLKNEIIATLAMPEMSLITKAVQPDDPRHRAPPLGGSADGRFTARYEKQHVIVSRKSAKAGALQIVQLGPFDHEPCYQIDDRGEQIAIASLANDWAPCEVTLYELPSGRILRSLKHPHGVLCMDWSGHLLATGTAVDRMVYVWNTSDGNRLHRLSGHNHDLQAVRFRPNGQELVSLAADGMVHLWHAGLGSEIMRLENVGQHGAPAWWNKDGTQLFTKRKNGPQVDIVRFDWPAVLQTLAPGTGEIRSENLPSLSASDDGMICAAVDETGCRVWDWHHGRQAGFVAKDGAEWLTAGLQSEQALWTSSWNTPLRRRQLQRDVGGWLRVLPHEPAPIESGPLLVAVRQGGAAVASTQNEDVESDDRVIVRWPQDNREVILHQPDPYCAALSPDGKWCVTGSFTARDEALLWSLPAGRLHLKLPHPGIVSGLMFVQNGKQLWMWGNKTLQCLNTDTWKPTSLDTRPSTGAFAVSADGQFAARIAKNKAILLRLPDVSPLAELPIGLQGGHVSLAFSTDARYLFIHGAKGEVHRWDLDATEVALLEAGIPGS
ncbi:MAG: protein kinase [Verrucomicrobiaceae bacterium]|nr:protein kinase [Verrucomicrobiaceae bacterium]